jgi:hypothetical protein
MARPESRSFWALGALGVAASCTVFNGKTLQNDGGASSDAPPSPSCGCANVAAVVCEDFEGKPNSPWKMAGDEPPLIDTSQHHCGASSLHLHTQAITNGSISSTLIESDTFTNPSLADGFYVRAWVYAPPRFTIAGNNFMALFEAHQDRQPFLGIAAQLGANTAAIANWTTAFAYEATKAAMPLDKWTCVEWHVAFRPTGASQLWVADASASLDPTNTNPTPPYNELIIGIYFSGADSAQPAVDLWIDELVIDSKRIGCDL